MFLYNHPGLVANMYDRILIQQRKTVKLNPTWPTSWLCSSLAETKLMTLHEVAMIQYVEDLESLRYSLEVMEGNS